MYFLCNSIVFFFDLNSIREMLIFYRLGPFFRYFWDFLYLFLSSVFTAICPFAKNRCKKILVGQLRKIPSCEKYYFYSTDIDIDIHMYHSQRQVCKLESRWFLYSNLHWHGEKTNKDWHDEIQKNRYFLHPLFIRVFSFTLCYLSDYLFICYLSLIH